MIIVTVEEGGCLSSIVIIIIIIIIIIPTTSTPPPANDRRCPHHVAVLYPFLFTGEIRITVLFADFCLLLLALARGYAATPGLIPFRYGLTSAVTLPLALPDLAC